jgi:hypothetical protein
MNDEHSATRWRQLHFSIKRHEQDDISSLLFLRPNQNVPLNVNSRKTT